jgi:hypothetical protein
MKYVGKGSDGRSLSSVDRNGVGGRGQKIRHAQGIGLPDNFNLLGLPVVIATSLAGFGSGKTYRHDAKDVHGKLAAAIDDDVEFFYETSRDSGRRNYIVRGQSTGAYDVSMRDNCSKVLQVRRLANGKNSS